MCFSDHSGFDAVKLAYEKWLRSPGQAFDLTFPPSNSQLTVSFGIDMKEEGLLLLFILFMILFCKVLQQVICFSFMIYLNSSDC